MAHFSVNYQCFIIRYSFGNYNLLILFFTKKLLSMDNQSKKLKVVAVEHEDGVITAFIKELPGLVVQGNSKDDVKSKLDALLETFIKKLEASRNNLEIVTQSFV